jgi:hypothetical protein
MKSLLSHPELRVVGVVLLSLAAGEAGMRLVGQRLSKDVEHLAHFSEIAAEIARRDAAEEPLQVLFLGNSLTRYGVAADEFREAAEAVAGQPLTVAKMTPDNTALADWFYAYRNYFAETGRAPDLLVIGFQDGHLADAPSNHPQRLAQFYCDADDWPELCEYDLRNFESRAGFVLASQSALVANRDRLERRALDTLIPGYQAGIQDLNSRVRSQQNRPAARPSYTRLERLLDLAVAGGTRVVLVAMPVPTPYAIDDALQQVVTQRGAALVDCREVAGITNDMFPDGLHMNDEAAARYSRHLAQTLDWGTRGQVARAAQ